jgi:hypothetical protein
VPLAIGVDLDRLAVDPEFLDIGMRFVLLKRMDPGISPPGGTVRIAQTQNRPQMTADEHR